MQNLWWFKIIGILVMISLLIFYGYLFMHLDRHDRIITGFFIGLMELACLATFGWVTSF